MRSPFALCSISTALVLALAIPASASPQARVTFPVPASVTTVITRPSFDILWTADAGSGPPLDHYVGKLVSEKEIQNALQLGNSPPTPAELQQYFGGQAPDFIGWQTFPLTETKSQVENLTAFQNYYFALTVVDQAGGFDGVFDLTRNLLRFRTTTDITAPAVQIRSPTPSDVGAVDVPPSFDVQWSLISPKIYPFDHFLSLIVSESDVQSALGLGTSDPSPGDLQTYFAHQAPGFAGWSSYPASQTGTHVSVAPGSQTYYLALTGVDVMGNYDPFFDLTRNLLRFTPNGPVPTVELTWGAVKASRR